MSRFVFVLCIFVLLSGCSTINTKDHKLVIDNTFYSSRTPKVKVYVDEDFKFIEKQIFDLKTLQGNDFKKDSFFFAKYDESRKIYKTLVIETLYSGHNFHWNDDVFMSTKDKISTNLVTINEGTYQQSVFFHTPNFKPLLQSGVVLSGRFITVGFGRNFGANNDTSFRVYYAESVPYFNKMAYSDENHGEHHWMNRDTYDPKRHREFNKLLERASKAFRISEITSADIAMLESPSPSLSVPSTSQPQGSAEQLKTLKELYDKGLITEDEYNGKRKEILDRM